jgi:hypothetical protein
MTFSLRLLFVLVRQTSEPRQMERDLPGKSEHDISTYLRDETMRYVNPPRPLSFATPNDGWMWGNARLLATSDGGASWSQIGGRLPLPTRGPIAGSPPTPVYPDWPAPRGNR